MLEWIKILIKYAIKDRLLQMGISLKEWHDRRCRRLQKRKSKNKVERIKYGWQEHKQCSKNVSFRKKSSQSPTTHYFNAPTDFSVFRNFNCTVAVFNSIIQKRRYCYRGDEFYLNAEAVTNIGVESLMFIIALVTDIKKALTLKQNFKGSFPKHSPAREMFTASGFLDYVNSNNTTINPKTECIQITQGENVDPPIAGQSCEFVQKICGLNRVDTMPLYEMIVELMGNTRQHAYEKGQEDLSATSWYLYAEEKSDFIEFVFLDTGLGIPKTVRKEWYEQLTFLGINNNMDSKLLSSALNGEFRTQTKEKRRGRGLPQILRCAKSGLISELVVFSGKGSCAIKANDEFVLDEKKTKMPGTLFAWQIKKGVEKSA